MSDYYKKISNTRVSADNIFDTKDIVLVEIRDNLATLNNNLATFFDRLDKGHVVIQAHTSSFNY